MMDFMICRMLYAGDSIFSQRPPSLGFQPDLPTGKIIKFCREYPVRRETSPKQRRIVAGLDALKSMPAEASAELGAPLPAIPDGTFEGGL
jgi:hypothetical protein